MTREDLKNALITIMRRLKAMMTYVLYLVCAVALIFWLIETGLKLVSFARKPPAWPVSEYHAKNTWINEYVSEETESNKKEWLPFIHYKGLPYRGKYITIDKNGLRRTWNPDPAIEGDPVQVSMFGGSTTWGVGARDDFTIPSILSRLIAEQLGLPARVVNYGELAFVSTQETILLMDRLRRGERPDVVIFYDGMNDPYTAFQAKKAGTIMNEVNRIREFNILGDKNRLLRATVEQTLQGTEIAKWVNHYKRTARIGRLEQGDYRGIELEPGLQRALVREVADIYAFNVDFVDKLGKAYGFAPFFFWQPVIFNKKSLTPFERRAAMEFGWLRPFFSDVYDTVRNDERLDGKPNFIDLSEVFVSSKELVFLDNCHVTEEGNRVIARAMLNAIEPKLRESAKRRRESKTARSGP